MSFDATDHMSTRYPKRTASSSHAGAPWAQFELVVANLTDGITVQDATGRLVYANDAGARMSGYSSPAELLAAPVGDFTKKFEILNEAGLPVSLAELPGRQALITGRGEAVLRVRERATGVERWNEVRAFAVDDESGERMFVVNLFRDVTLLMEQQKLLQEQAQELEEQTAQAQALAEELEQSNDELARALHDEEEARQREEFLSRVTAILGSSLDYETTLTRVADSVVPELADWCAVDLRDDEANMIRRVAVAHVDPDKVRWAWELGKRFPVDLAAPTGVAKVLRTGEPELYPVISDAMLEQSAGDPDQLRILRELSLTSAMIVPLGGDDRVAGAMTFVFAESRKQYDEDDLAFATELGRRAGMAVERATLHREAVTARIEAEHAYAEASTRARWLSRLQRLTVGLSRSLTLNDAVDIALSVGSQAFEAQLATVRLLSADRAALVIAGQRGLSSDLAQRMRSLPVDAAALAGEAVRSGELVLIENQEEFRNRYGGVDSPMLDSNAQAIASTPIRVGGEIIGALTYGYDRPHTFDPDYLTAIRTFAKELGQAIERTRGHARLDEARRAADAANQAKSAFLATMSHELRTPINAILGFTDLLELGIASDDKASASEYVGRIRRNTAHLLELINDILDWSKVEAGQLAIDSGEALAADVVAESINIVRQQAVGRNVSLDFECADGARYLGDPLRVRQILLNLLSNAIKYTEPGGHITVRCGFRDSFTYFAVQDTGIGIAADEFESIFEPFVQSEHVYTRTHGGTGLGLAISRRLARLMGGDVTVESTVGSGSTFTLSLPSRERRAVPRHN
ncbi:MAG TPA: ATP-binding protein [Gemmatimonadaceae bacterium]|nr:ATP-binding protein [Gemmatimonadaceae bacterium]